MPSIDVFPEVGLQRVQRHEEFDLYLYSVSFVPYDVCTCVFGRLLSLLLISERGLVRGKLVSLNHSWDEVSRKKVVQGISVKKNRFLSKNLSYSQSNQNHLAFSNCCDLFTFRSKGPLLTAPIIKIDINCRARIFAKLVFEEFVWFAYLVWFFFRTSYIGFPVNGFLPLKLFFSFTLPLPPWP